MYTLRENENLEQSITLFNKKFSNYKVMSEVGVDEEDGRTVLQFQSVV